LDLHNNFDFRNFQYDEDSKQLELVWTRSQRANERICSFKLVFKFIEFLKIRNRNYSNLPDTETCLAFIGFLPQDQREDFDSFVKIKDAKGVDDLNICFESDLAFKVNCSYAEFIESNEEIIYVAIKNEYPAVWRPMWAERIEELTYRINSYSDYDPELEDLEFVTDEIVICEKKEMSNGYCLVAVRKYI
jgi:hypothetical protein